VFDCLLAYTARGRVDTIWTDNTKHFTAYPFLKTEPPLDGSGKKVTFIEIGIQVTQKEETIKETCFMSGFLV